MSDRLAVDDLAVGEPIGAVCPDRVAARAAVHAVGVAVVHMRLVVARTGEDHIVLAQRALDHVGGSRSGDAARASQRSPDDDREVTRAARAWPRVRERALGLVGRAEAGGARKER